jgi:hypothetical protein
VYDRVCGKTRAGQTIVRLLSQLLFDVRIAYCDSSRGPNCDAYADDNGSHTFYGECDERRRAAAIETTTPRVWRSRSSAADATLERERRAVFVENTGASDEPGRCRLVAIRAGRKLFAQNCASCHGDNGGGDGLAAAASARAPTNFRIQQPSVEYARTVLSEGVRDRRVASMPDATLRERPVESRCPRRTGAILRRREVPHIGCPI